MPVPLAIIIITYTYARPAIVACFAIGRVRNTETHILLDQEHYIMPRQ